jgi:hypothetical protein
MQNAARTKLASAAANTRKPEGTSQAMFNKLMKKDWRQEFTQVEKNLGKLNKQERKERMMKKDPAAFFLKHSPNALKK